MARQVLNLGSLIQLDGGRAEKAFNLALQTVVADLEDRPGETKSRKVMFELNIAPSKEEHGGVVDAEVTFRVGHKIPGRQTKAYRMKIDGVLPASLPDKRSMLGMLRVVDPALTMICDCETLTPEILDREYRAAQRGKGVKDPVSVFVSACCKIGGFTLPKKRATPIGHSLALALPAEDQENRITESSMSLGSRKRLDSLDTGRERKQSEVHCEGEQKRRIFMSESMVSFKDQVRAAVGLILEEIDASNDANASEGRSVWLTKCDAVMNNEIAKRMMFAANGFCVNCHKDLTRDIFGREIIEWLGLAFIAKSGYGYTVTRKDGRWWCNQMWEVEKFPERPAYAELKTARSALAEAGRVNDIRT